MAAQDDDTPAARLLAAVGNKPNKAYAEVSAADVVAVAQAVPDDLVSKVTLALAKGAAGALADWRGEPDELKVFQLAGQVRELLERAGVETKPV